MWGSSDLATPTVRRFTLQCDGRSLACILFGIVRFGKCTAMGDGAPWCGQLDSDTVQGFHKLAMSVVATMPPYLSIQSFALGSSCSAVSPSSVLCTPGPKNIHTSFDLDHFWIRTPKN